MVTSFGIQADVTTRDIVHYKDWALRNMEYDAKGKVYVCTSGLLPFFSAEGMVTAGPWRQ